jgi:hypothetical protein
MLYDQQEYRLEAGPGMFFENYGILKRVEQPPACIWMELPPAHLGKLPSTRIDPGCEVELASTLAGTVNDLGRLAGVAQALRGYTPVRRDEAYRSDERKGLRIMNRLLSPGKLLAKTVAAVAIALFWCISAVGTTVGTTVGITTLATGINAATSTPAEARRRWRRGRRGRRRWRRGGLYGYPYYRRGYPYHRRGWYGPRFGLWFGF